MINSDSIILKVPAKPEYVLVTRLTASAIGSRLQFTFDEIEDLKVAVAEGSILIMNQVENLEWLNLVFTLHDCELTVEISACNSINEYTRAKTDNDIHELSIYIIQSMMDSVAFHKDDNELISSITMYKKSGGY